MVKFTVYGCVHDAGSFFCDSLAKKICTQNESCESEFFCMFEVEFLIKIGELKKEKRNENNLALSYYKKHHIVLQDGVIVGDMDAFIALALSDYSIDNAEAANTILYNRQVRELSYTMMKERGRPIVFLEITDASDKDQITLGTVFIELFDDLCPKGTDNFVKLCVGARQPGGGRKAPLMHYENTRVHRIVKDGWIQCGDIVDSTGANSAAVLDLSGTVPDESFAVDFGFPPGGIVGYANSGSHTNGSQFFITMGPCEWMNSKFVGFGRVIQGFDVLRAINLVPTSNQYPQKNILIEHCGVAPEAQS